MIIRVPNESLASVMVLNKKLEEYPEPYRGQSDMTLVVSFEQYVRFIDKYLEVTDYLNTPTVYLRSKLELDDEGPLYKAFYKDVACAIMKELWYTHRGGDPTKLVHTLGDAPVYGDFYVDAVLGAYKREVASARQDMLDLVEQAGFQFDAGVLYRQQKSVDYASLLFAMSSPTNEYGVDFVKWSMMEE